MDLLPRINSLPLLRQHGVPQYLRRVCLITIADELKHIPAFHRLHPWLIVERIALIDGRPGGEAEYEVDGKTLTVPIGDLGSLIGLCHLEKVIITPQNDVYAQIPQVICRGLAGVGIRNFFVYSRKPIKIVSQRRQADFLNRNIQALKQAHAMLADEDSRNVLAARIKAVITGDASYLPIAGFVEYFHPLVQPQPGDVLIDGGISDNVEVQLKFAEAVGPQGKIYGFEPIADMYAAAARKLAVCPQYEMFCAGLGQSTGKTRFELLGDSSHMSDKSDNTVECDIVSIDDFVRDKGLEKVDCIKLDIEGAELAALLGASQTIQRFKPRLIICLYHKNEDMFELPAFIKDLVPEYELYAAHSSYHFIDTILYARPNGQALA